MEKVGKGELLLHLNFDHLISGSMWLYYSLCAKILVCVKVYKITMELKY